MAYKTINGWTKARMLERLRARVPKNGCRYSDGTCRYRAIDDGGEVDRTGACCAVGAFIPDDAHEDVLAYDGSVTMAVRNGVIDATWLPLDKDLMYALQVQHDSAPPGDALARCILWVEENVEEDA